MSKRIKSKTIKKQRASTASPSFVKFDDEKTRYELLDPLFLEGVAKVLTFGAIKYSANNWLKCLSVMRYFGALQRHLWKWALGYDLDEETKISHLYHAGCCLMFMIGLLYRNPKCDDRMLVDKDLSCINLQQPNKPKKKKK